MAHPRLAYIECIEFGTVPMLVLSSMTHDEAYNFIEPLMEKIYNVSKFKFELEECDYADIEVSVEDLSQILKTLGNTDFEDEELDRKISSLPARLQALGIQWYATTWEIM